MIFGLELITIEKGKTAGIRPRYSRTESSAKGSLIPAYHCKKFEVEPSFGLGAGDKQGKFDGRPRE